MFFSIKLTFKLKTSNMPRPPKSRGSSFKVEARPGQASRILGFERASSLNIRGRGSLVQVYYVVLIVKAKISKFQN